jgi:hypothetical protein
VFVLGHFLLAPLFGVCHVLTSLGMSFSTPILQVTLTPLSLPFTATCLAYGLAFRNTTLLALGNKVSLLFGVAQNPISGHFFPKAPEQAFWRLSLP